MNLIFLDDERDLEDVTWINYPEFNNVDIVRTFDAFKTKFKILVIGITYIFRLIMIFKILMKINLKIPDIHV
jgi:hypothetical protein